MTTSQKLKDDFLTCHICMEVYQKPVTLHCEHTYCHSCLSKYIKTQTEAVKTKSIPCPSCRRPIPVPHPGRPVEEWAAQFRTGLVIQGLMDSFGGGNTDHCSVCKEDGKTTPAAHWCSECEASLCDGCQELHRKMPILRHHGVSNLTGEKPREQVRKKKFVCKEHDEKIKLFCKDCKKTLCTVCCSLGHRTCKDIVTMQAMLPAVKQEVSYQQARLTEKIDEKSKLISENKRKTDGYDAKTAKVKAEISQTFDVISDMLQRKKKQLLDRVDDIKNRQTGELKAKIKCEEIARQTYQQQFQFIQQALKFEDEAQLYGMYLSSGPGAVAGDTETDSEDRTNVVDIGFTHNMEKLREDIEMMDVTTCDDVIDLTSSPVLQYVIDMKLDERDPDLCDVVVFNNNEIKKIFVTDFEGKCMRTLYMKNIRNQITFGNGPWALAQLDENKILVTIPDEKKILTFDVTPDLQLLSTIRTSKEYHGLAVLDHTTLVAGSVFPPSVDVLDMTGNVLRSFTTLASIQKTFQNPYYLHVTNNGNILVSDWGLESVICLTPTGEVVFHYSPFGDIALKGPHGITSTTTGDILLVDLDEDKVIHLTQSGEFVKDILTSKDGINEPIGLCIDRDKLYIATWHGGVHVFRFS